MSLDIWLTFDGERAEGDITSGIYIREKGQNRKISREEWDRRFPNRDPIVCNDTDEDNEVYGANITHNLARMAEEAGLYYPLWRPEEICVIKAKQLIVHLCFGLEKLKADPERFKAFNPSNGWGTYEGLVNFTQQYLEACQQYPEATINVSR